MIYTKKGDRGKTSLFNSRVVSKNSRVIATIGVIDELNSYLGIVRSENNDKFIDIKIKKLQGDLFLIGAIIAGYKTSFDKGRIKEIEEDIDELESKLPLQTSFIFFTGTRTATLLFYARSIARRAERLLIALGKTPNPLVLSYINRLSDYLFILGRYCNFKEFIKEEYWKLS